MPSRDMSLLNTMMPTSMFTLGESGAGVRAGHGALREPGLAGPATHRGGFWGSKAREQLTSTMTAAGPTKA